MGRSATDRLRVPPVSNDLDAKAGLDVKYGITANLVADFTYNTDFAQVEVDEQQVNLTRFNLFFPEKRDFFLEGRGIFDFARGGASAATSGRWRRWLGQSASNAAIGDAVPLLQPAHRAEPRPRRADHVGARMTGKVGKFGVGVAEHPGRRRTGVGARRRPTSA